MTRRPIYRWKSFWLGVLVLVFLGWGRMRSSVMTDVLTWGYNGNGDFIVLWHYGGQICFTKRNDPFYRSAEAPGISAESLKQSRAAWYGPDGMMLGLGEGIHWKCSIRIVMLIFFSVWCGWLAWRWRRMRGAGVVSEGSR